MRLAFPRHEDDRRVAPRRRAGARSTLTTISTRPLRANLLGRAGRQAVRLAGVSLRNLEGHRRGGGLLVLPPRHGRAPQDRLHPFAPTTTTSTRAGSRNDSAREHCNSRPPTRARHPFSPSAGPSMLPLKEGRRARPRLGRCRTRTASSPSARRRSAYTTILSPHAMRKASSLSPPARPFSVSEISMRDRPSSRGSTACGCTPTSPRPPTRTSSAFAMYGRRPLRRHGGCGFSRPESVRARYPSSTTRSSNAQAQTKTGVALRPSSNIAPRFGHSPRPRDARPRRPAGSLAVDGSASNDSSDMLGEA